MIRGTTQKLLFDIGIDVNEVSQLWLTFSHSNIQNSELLNKTKDDVILSGTTVEVALSQEETLLLNQYNLKDKVIYIQLRALLNDGQALASSIVEITVEHLLKGGVIE